MRDDFTHTIVSANGAQPVQTSGAPSVFALGGNAGQAEPEEAAPAGDQRRRSTSRTEQAREALKACGPLTPTKLAAALGVDRSVCTKLCSNLAQRKLLVRHGKEAGETVYGLPNGSPQPPSNFKKWLERKGAQSAEGRAKPVPTAKAAAPSAAVSSAFHFNAPRAPGEERAEPTLQVALFNTGDLLIEPAGQAAVRLSKLQARELVDYLDSISKALQAE